MGMLDCAGMGADSDSHAYEYTYCDAIENRYGDTDQDCHVNFYRDGQRNADSIGYAHRITQSADCDGYCNPDRNGYEYANCDTDPYRELSHRANQYIAIDHFVVAVYRDQRHHDSRCRRQ